MRTPIPLTSVYITDNYNLGVPLPDQQANTQPQVACPVQSMFIVVTPLLTVLRPQTDDIFMPVDNVNGVESLPI